MSYNGYRFPIRQVTREDTQWLHEVGRKAYVDGTYDPEAAEKWIKALMESPNHLLLRGERAWIVAWVQSTPFRPSFKTGHFLIVASLGNAIKELRTMTSIVLEWAKERGANRFYWAAITGVDFGPIAEAFGAIPVSPSYMLELTDG